MKDYFGSKGWLTRYSQAEDSTGVWQKYVAEVQRSEMDNFNTPDLDQGADSILRPGETLEDDFDVNFRKANAEGGFQQLVNNTDDGSRPGYSGDKINDAIKEIVKTKTTFDSKSQLIDLLEDKLGYRPSPKGLSPNRYYMLDKIKYKTVLPITTEEQLIETFGEEYLTKERAKGVSEKKLRDRRFHKLDFANLTSEEKSKKTEDTRQRNKNLSEEQILDRKEKAIVRRQSQKGFSFYKVNNAENLLWNDLLRTAKNKNGYFTFKGEPPVSGKYYNKVETEKFVLVDKKGNEFKYSTLSEDITKHSGEKLENVLRPYKQKEFLAKEGLTKELNKLAGYKPGATKSVFHTQHIQGIDKNPFKVHLTFGEQNLSEAASKKSFDADWKAANKKPLGEGARFKAQKEAVNRYYKSLGPDIVAQIGKQPKGEIKTLINLLDKTGIKLTDSQTTGAKSLEAKIKELGGKEKVTQLLTNGSGTGAERTLLKQIITGGNTILKSTGKFVAGALNPVDFFKLKNLIGFPAAIAAVAFDTVAIADDVIRKGQPFDVAAGNEFLTQFLDLNTESKQAQRILDDKGSNLSPAAKEYAEALVDFGKYKDVLKEKNDISKAGSLETFEKDQTKIDKQLKVLEEKMKNMREDGVFDYQAAVNELGINEEQSEYIGEPKKAGMFTYAADDESEDGFYRNADGNRIKVNEYGYATKGNIFDSPSKTGARVDKKLPYGETDQGRNPALLTEGEKIFRAETKQPAKYQKPFTYKDFNYQNKALSDGQYNNALKYYQDQGFVKPDQKLENVNIPKGYNKRIVNGKEYDPPKTLLQYVTDVENIDDKWKQAIYQPGMLGTQDKFAEGGLAGLMKKYYD